MELLVALIIGVLVATGVYLCLRARTFSVVLGLTLLGYGVNVFLFSMGGLKINQVAVVGAMTAFLVVLALRSQGEQHSDHVDGQDGEQRS